MTPTAPWRDPISGRWIEPAKPIPDPPPYENAIEMMARYMEEEKAKIHAEHVWRQVVDIASGTNAPTKGVPPVIPPVCNNSPEQIDIAPTPGFQLDDEMVIVWAGPTTTIYGNPVLDDEQDEEELG